MSCYSLKRLIKSFEETGSLEAKPRSGRPSTCKSVAVTVLQNAEAIETLSTYGELKVSDFEKRQEFAAWGFRQIDIDENWLSIVLRTDYAHFYLKGEFNIQNCLILATETPRNFTEIPLHQHRVTVLCGFTSSFIFGPIFFENINGRTFKTVFVTGERYVQLLREKVIPILQDRQALSEITFMQDGGPPHISRGAKQLLKDTEVDRTLSQPSRQDDHNEEGRKSVQIEARKSKDGGTNPPVQRNDQAIYPPTTQPKIPQNKPVRYSPPSALQRNHLPGDMPSSPNRIHKLLQALHGTSSALSGRQLKNNTVKKWVAAFKLGRISTEDEHRPGRSVESVTQENIDKIHVLVMLDRRMTVRRIEETLGILKTTVDWIMRENLGLGKLSARWVPKLLTSDQKAVWRKLFSDNLALFEANPEEFLSRFVTMDETWAHHFTPESRQQSMQWRTSGSLPPKKAKTVPSAGKVMVSVFGIPRVYFL
ncbi:hypothetical protein LAZ67_X002509 [Cordylochernes scorpioides]|uniref:Transposase n=1 Tax=Cordylochernes scorpioides TaxID=51811 RepID=A0ABY6LXK3_9ARAC|nr:hypothetical protein LAZ67_X002509 [Cordylochernes scorpioides]